MLFNIGKKFSEEIGQNETSFQADELLAKFRRAYVLSSDEWKTAEVESDEFAFGISIDLSEESYDGATRARIGAVLCKLDVIRNKSDEGDLRYIEIDGAEVTISYWGTKVNTEWDERFIIEDDGSLTRLG